MKDTELHAILNGRVQGVGCRATVKYLATQHGLKGIVRNLPNGSVEIYAQGPKEVLESFIEQIQNIPPPIKVASVAVEYKSPTTSHASFNIVN